MTVHGTRIFAQWIVATLDAGGLATELADKPAEATLDNGWAVVWPIAGGTVDGTLAAPNDDATPEVQVTCVAYYKDQTLWVVDRVRTLLAAAVPATLSDGRRVTRFEPVFAQPTLLRDNDVDPPTWYCPDRFAYRTTPT